MTPSPCDHLRLRHVCVLLGLLLCDQAPAVDYSLTIDPLPAGLSEARFELWLPDTLTSGQRVRGMIGSSNYHDGANVLTSTSWRSFASARQMGIIRYLVRVGGDPIGTDQASANAVLSALTQFAGLAGRPELQYTCLVPTGLSWGAHQVCQFHRYIPSRIIGGVAFRGTASDVTTAASADAKLIPLLHKSAGQESFDGYRTEQSHTAFANMGTSGQALNGSNFANTVGPNEPHHEFGDLTFVQLWLDAVIAARLPASIPASSAVVLQTMDQTVGWSGYYDVSTNISAAPWNGGRGFINASIAPCTGGVRPANIRTWLPNQQVAQGWLTYAQTGTLSSSPSAPVIVAQPANQSVMVGQTATFAVSASGTPTPTFQWQKNNVNIGGATSESYTTPATVIGDNGATYRCVVTNSAGAATSNAATLTVNAVTLRDPENPAGAVAGLTYAYYTVSTDGTIPNLAALAPIATGTVTTFDLSPRTRDDNIAFAFNGYLAVPTDGVYTLFTSSDDGSRLLIGTTTVVDNDGSHAMQERSGVIGLKAGRHALTVHFAQGVGGFGLEVRWEGPGIAKALVPASALFRTGTGTGTVPTITGQPVTRSVVVGATASFSVTATGTPTPTFQWQKNNLNIGGATSASYTTPATVIGDTGTTYRCVATNSAGAATSNAATLTVTVTVVADTTPPPKPSTPSVTGNGGAAPTLSGTAEAGTTITLLEGGTVVATTVATGGTWTLAPTLAAGSHTLHVTATDAAGNVSTASDPVTITVAAGSGSGSGTAVSGDSSGQCGIGSGIAAVMLALMLALTAALRPRPRG